MGDIFQFRSSASLEKLTGRKAQNLEELLALIETCSESSIFYHTFSAFLKMREVRVPYNSDFAIWVARMLNEKGLAEKLTAIDLSEFNTIGDLRGRLIEVIKSYRHQIASAFQKMANEPFYLHDMVRVVYLTDKFAYDLHSFRNLLTSISVYSLYFHFIESRLQTHLQTDDFSSWMEESLNMPDLARRIREVDINVYTLEGLRARIIQLIDENAHNAQQKSPGSD